MTLTILHLYPKEMNLYGDHGNVLTLVKRCEWRGYRVKVVNYEAGDELPEKVDIVIGGGGQDAGQAQIEEDLRRIGTKLKGWVEDGVPMLMICGMYQLFGNFFKTQDGDTIEGISALDIDTVAGDRRLIGNVVVKSRQFGEIVGYENHSGITRLGESMKPLGRVLKGAGNNGDDRTEGVLYNNTIGTYLHGPLLPKNPRVADFLIQVALERKYGAPQNLPKFSDRLEQKAHRVSAERPR
jgi:CobQ-like glutamine amidotransferase family enzyme